METGIQYMFTNKKTAELYEIYKLFSRSIESLKVITEIMQPYIRERGEAIYNNRDLAKDPTSKSIVYYFLFFRIYT
jgi:hypothetical protein